jgi:hypothetical protein
VQGLGTRLIALYLRTVMRTGRWKHLDEQHARELWERGEPFLIAFWHGRMLLAPIAWRTDRPASMLSSSHRDGAMISRAVAMLGFGTILGSSTRGGLAAAREILRALRGGTSVGITPDGPRGPRMRVGGGVIDLARTSGVPIVPLSFSVTRGRSLASWDRCLVSYPFSRGVAVWGAPIRVPKGADQVERAACARRLEEALNALTERADRECGRETPEPAPLEPSPTDERSVAHS